MSLYKSIPSRNDFNLLKQAEFNYTINRKPLLLAAFYFMYFHPSPILRLESNGAFAQ